MPAHLTIALGIPTHLGARAALARQILHGERKEGGRGVTFVTFGWRDPAHSPDDAAVTTL